MSTAITRAWKIPSFMAVTMLIAILSSGCAGVPKPSSDNDTLLLVPITMDNGTTESWTIASNYKIRLESDAGERWIGVRTANDYEIVHGLLPGEYAITGVTSTYAGEKPFMFDNPVRFVLNPGELKIFPYSISITIYRQKGSLWESFRLKPLDPETKYTLLDSLRKEENIELWQIDFN